jgi:hypothetical protein
MVLTTTQHTHWWVDKGQPICQVRSSLRRWCGAAQVAPAANDADAKSEVVTRMMLTPAPPELSSAPASTLLDA